MWLSNRLRKHQLMRFSSEQDRPGSPDFGDRQPLATQIDLTLEPIAPLRNPVKASSQSVRFDENVPLSATQRAGPRFESTGP